MSGIGRLIDYAPTILELAGVKHKAMDGHSMLADFQKGSFACGERFAESGIAESGSCISMVDSNNMKFLAYNPEPLPEGERNLEIENFHKMAVFDLKADPWEYVNLADTSMGRCAIEWAVKRHAELRAESAK